MNEMQPPKRPKWVVALAFTVVVIVAVLAIVALTTSGHGPGRHM
jgi:hypothetical protein